VPHTFSVPGFTDTETNEEKQDCGPLAYTIHPTRQNPQSDFILVSPVLGRSRRREAQRRSSQSSWDNRLCTDGTIKERYPEHTMKACTGDL
jgi:hypothetical protein